MEHDSDSESYATSSENEENISGAQSNDIPILLIAEVRQGVVLVSVIHIICSIRVRTEVSVAL
jgi:hypothetical protein